MFNDWCKRDIIPKISLLQKHPSVIQYIIGHRGDGKPVLKVYLCNNDAEAKMFFEKSCSKDTKIEYVFVENNRKILKEIESIKFYEKKAPAIDTPTMNHLKNIILEYGEQVFARYSNVVGLQISNVRCMGKIPKEEPCIVLYCLDKTIIPFGENLLPESLRGWPCDIREDIFMLGSRAYSCPTNCLSPNQPGLGCSIGKPFVMDSGSVGFFYKSTNPTNGYGCGFLTASHVAVNGFEELHLNNSLLSMNHLLSLRNHIVVHPSHEDCGSVNRDNTVGKVVESFCGNYELNQFGMDFAVVKCDNWRIEGAFKLFAF